MRNKNLFPRLIISTLLILGLLFPALSAVMAHPAKVLTGNAGCVFGYTLQTGLDFASQWKEIRTTGTLLNFGSRPDDVIVQVGNIGFNFPFFENSYSSVYVSTNGFVTFNQYQSAYPSNYGIPMEFPPNNIVAGFWDDLTVGGSFNSGSAYYQIFGSAPNRSVVFEWYQVTRFGSSDPLTFEIILNENGDVYLNYATLNGVLNQATVGIEDADGVDGNQVLYDASGLASNQIYRLAYPADGSRVKAKPLYQGGFLTNGLLDLPLFIVNTGTSPDTFSFQTAITGSPDGQVKIVNEQGVTITNTPALNPKQSFSARIRVTASTTGAVGSKWSGTVTAISNTNNARRFVVDFDAANPAPFAALYVDGTTAYTKYISKDRQISAATLPNFSGKNFSITRLSGFKYFLAWEEAGSGVSGSYKNIKKAIASSFAGLSSPVANLTDNSGLGVPTFDETPMVAVASNGMIGVVFVRWTTNALGDQINANIYFARLNGAGTLLAPVQNLTQDSATFTDLLYSHPTITATPTNLFVITYEALTPLGGVNTTKDIDLVIVDTNGGVVRAPHHLTNSQTSGFNYYSPASTAMQNGYVFVTFLSYQPGQPNGVSYIIYHPDDNSAASLQTISNASGEGPQITTSSNGNLVLAWVKSSLLGLGYVLFNPQGVPISTTPQELVSWNGWKIEQISMAGTLNGNIALTWKDEWNIFLYYSLIDANGSVVTSPMAFLHGTNPDSSALVNSTTGEGIAPLGLIKYDFIPLTTR